MLAGASEQQQEREREAGAGAAGATREEAAAKPEEGQRGGAAFESCGLLSRSRSSLSRFSCLCLRAASGAASEEARNSLDSTGGSGADSSAAASARSDGLISRKASPRGAIPARPARPAICRYSALERRGPPGPAAPVIPPPACLRERTMARTAGRLTPAASVDVAANAKTAPSRKAASTAALSPEDRPAWCHATPASKARSSRGLPAPAVSSRRRWTAPVRRRRVFFAAAAAAAAADDDEARVEEREEEEGVASTEVEATSSVGSEGRKGEGGLRQQRGQGKRQHPRRPLGPRPAPAKHQGGLARGDGLGDQRSQGRAVPARRRCRQDVAGPLRGRDLQQPTGLGLDPDATRSQHLFSEHLPRGGVCDEFRQRDGARVCDEERSAADPRGEALEPGRRRRHGHDLQPPRVRPFGFLLRVLLLLLPLLLLLLRLLLLLLLDRRSGTLVVAVEQLRDGGLEHGPARGVGDRVRLVDHHAADLPEPAPGSQSGEAAVELLGREHGDVLAEEGPGGARGGRGVKGRAPAADADVCARVLPAVAVAFEPAQ